MTKSNEDVSIMKTLWGKQGDGRWAINNMRGLTLKPQNGCSSDFFKFESDLELLTQSPRHMNNHQLLTSFGNTDFLMKQSILPVIAWVKGEHRIRCIGTAFVISCSGYIMTACHVLLDPKDRDYGKVVREGNILNFLDDLMMGVFIPVNPAYGIRGFRFLPFERSWYWGEWKSSPLIHEDDKFDILTDIAICKIPRLPDDVAHQPLNLSLNNFKKDEQAYAFGYAEMDDIPVQILDGKPTMGDFEHEIFVSVGEVAQIFPKNHLEMNVPTPGPCFDFKAKIPGKMSGGPILGAQGAAVRGVISRSFSGEKHAYGAMLGPTMHLPLMNNETLHSMMMSGNEGITRVEGQDL